MKDRLGSLLARVDGAGDGMFDAVIRARSASVRRASRRDFLRMSAAIAGGLGLPRSVVRASAITRASADLPPVASSMSTGGRDAEPSDVGSLYPFIRSQAMDGVPPLSYLNPRFRSLLNWRRTARARLLELLHYDPPPVDPRPTLIGRTDA